MSEAKHTPGPWQTMPEECDRPYIRVRGARPGTRYKIANVLVPTYGGVGEHEMRESRANARLIAAAPDLLAACESLTNRLTAFAVLAPLDRYDHDAIRAGEAAIANATATHDA